MLVLSNVEWTQIPNGSSGRKYERGGFQTSRKLINFKFATIFPSCILYLSPYISKQYEPAVNDHFVFCLTVPRPKLGECPKGNDLAGKSGCTFDCTTDFDCKGRKKCCKNRCGSTNCIGRIQVNTYIGCYRL